MLPRAKFAHLPTPIESLPRLSAALGGPTLFVKRDDQTGLAIGGNKTRKLEYALGEAQAQGAKTLITIGAIQSNHCRQTAAAAARMGYECILVLNGDPDELPSGNLFLDHVFGAKIVWTDHDRRAETVKSVFDEAWQAGKRPYLIPVGASNAVGAMGYVTAFEEFISQNVDVDYIVFASSSGGTQAGLVLGARRADWKGHILGISVDEKMEDLQEMVAFIASEASDRLGEKIRFKPGEIEVNDDYIGAGYAIMGRPEQEAIQLFARLEGLLVDPVYTGRAAAGLIDLIRKGFFHQQDRVLFWHTGGSPALFADVYRSKTLADGG